MKSLDRPRFKVLINGKWQGGSFLDEDAAKAAAAKVSKLGDKVTIVKKGGPEEPPKK